jgi:hypothetical protein
MHGNGEVHGILSFAIEPIYDEDRAILLSELNVLVDPSIRIEVKSFFEEVLVLCGEDESQLREIRGKLLALAKFMRLSC